MEKIYKYATGQEIPEGAIYLFTRIQKVEPVIEYVWHYFLVEVNEDLIKSNGGIKMPEDETTEEKPAEEAKEEAPAEEKTDDTSDDTGDDTSEDSEEDSE